MGFCVLGLYNLNYYLFWAFLRSSRLPPLPFLLSLLRFCRLTSSLIAPIKPSMNTFNYTFHILLCFSIYTSLLLTHWPHKVDTILSYSSRWNAPANHLSPVTFLTFSFPYSGRQNQHWIEKHILHN